MKIAFASCVDAIDDPEQPVWDEIRVRKPDVVLFLGDMMYMDYGAALLGSNRPLGWPRKVTNEVFAATMHERYKRQWNVLSFRNLLASGAKIEMTWDDHDFAWNNSRGLGSQKHFAVDRNKRLIAQQLFQQFRAACHGNPDSTYPDSPAVQELLKGEEQGIQVSFEHKEVLFVMLDGRSFREDPNIGADADMLGHPQREWLGQKLKDWPGVVVIGSGSVLTGSEESWAKYRDYAWLLGFTDKRVIVLTGDIHKNVLPVRHSASVFEVTSSGAARPGLGGGLSHIGGARGNYGMLTIGETVAVTLHSQDNPNGANATIKFGQ